MTGRAKQRMLFALERELLGLLEDAIPRRPP
jgi:hypothetical protein